MKLRIINLIILAIVTIGFSQGFVHRFNEKIVDGNGDDLLLRGVGLGGWLVPEGYMLNTPGGWGPTLINSGIVALIGEEKAKVFWAEYTKNYVTKADIDLIAQWGFNSIRLPFHYKRFIMGGAEMDTSGYVIVDELIEWCLDNDLYLILDMHCAPGGQSDSPSISDSDGTAKLWMEDPFYRNQTVQIWQQIARRYANETVIAGYDLINEPVLPYGFDNADLREFYVRVTDSIRQVDNNHMIFAEGNWYATDFAYITPKWDDNMGFSFHKYWSNTNTASINNHLSMRIENVVPLWMGESGENSNPWFHEVVEMLESNNIGWNWWTHKKFEKITSPLSANLPAGYSQLQTYWDGGAKPSAGFAETVLMEMADNLKLSKCVLRPGVIPALFDREFKTKSKPVRSLTIPGYVPAVDYDIGTEGVAYHDNDYKDTGDRSAYNRGYIYRNDGVDIEKSSTNKAGQYNVGFVEDGEWIKYTVNVQKTDDYDLNFHVASAQETGQFRLILDGTSALTGFVYVPNTGGWQNWQIVSLENVSIPAGEHTITFQVATGGFNIKGFDFIGGSYTDIEVENNTSESLNIYPNPSRGKLNLNYSGTKPTKIKFEIYNVLGQKVWEWSGPQIGLKHNYTWDNFGFLNKGLSSGMYFYKVKTSFGTKRGKILFLLN